MWLGAGKDIDLPVIMGVTQSDSGRFATTRWSVVLSAGSPSSPHYQEAISTLCQTYWFPLYAYLRRQGCTTHQAEDHIQAFFAQMLEKGYLERVEANGGKFRSFLLVALKRFVADQRDRDRAIKRGGGHKKLDIDLGSAEDRYASEPATDLSPERIFAKAWALAVLDRTMVQLELEYKHLGKQELFDYIKVYLGGETHTVPYKQVAEDLSMSEDAVKMAVYRLRKYYRELLRAEIAQTVASQDQVEEEIQNLFVALGD